MRRGEKRPNILLITTDQQAASTLEARARPHLRTPSMDWLAGEGTRFEKAYCSNPLCVPSRTSYMTGTMPSENGVTYNTEAFRFDTRAFPCLAKEFLRAGYQTAHFGKWHVPEPLENREWSGFEQIGARADNGIDDKIAPECLRFLGLRDPGRPFFAVASFVNPHDICEYARILSGIPDILRNGEIPPLPDSGALPPLPENWGIPDAEPPAIREMCSDPGNARTYPARAWGGREDPRWRQYLWAYYRMVELVDHRIGDLLHGARELGILEDAFIVFASDHGDGAASHRWNQKTLFYEECARVPLILRWPGRVAAGQTNSSRLVNLGTDLFPTLFEAAGIPVPPHLRGTSFLPDAFGYSAGPDHVVSESNLQISYGKPGRVSGMMLRDAKHKYIRYDSGHPREMLFDLEEDPLEQNNLAASPAHAEILGRYRRCLQKS